MYERNGDHFQIPLPQDEDGYLGCECPECEKYFKLTPGTGVPDEDQTYCPYCGHRAAQNDFATKDQIEYATSLIQQYVQDEFHKMFKNLERKYPKHRAKRQMIGFYVEAGPKPHVPIRYYSEQELETRVTYVPQLMRVVQKCTIGSSIVRRETVPCLRPISFVMR